MRMSYKCWPNVEEMSCRIYVGMRMSYKCWPNVEEMSCRIYVGPTLAVRTKLHWTNIIFQRRGTVYQHCPNNVIMPYVQGFLRMGIKFETGHQIKPNNTTFLRYTMHNTVPAVFTILDNINMPNTFWCFI